MTTAVEVRAPAEQTEGTRSQVLRWLKNVGEAVTENEPLIEIETDKVTVEVASPGSGILREIVKGEQEEIAPGEVLGRIDAGDAGDGQSSDAGGGDFSLRDGEGVSHAGAQRAGGHADVARVGGAVGVGHDAGLDGTVTLSRLPTEVASREPDAMGGTLGQSPSRQSAGGQSSTGRPQADSPPTGSRQVGSPQADIPDGQSPSRQSVGGQSPGRESPGGQSPGFAANRLSPAVRRLLSENSLDPASIRGTGQGGRITVEDVLGAIPSGRGGARNSSAVAGGAAGAAAGAIRPDAIGPASAETGAIEAQAVGAQGAEVHAGEAQQGEAQMSGPQAAEAQAAEAHVGESQAGEFRWLGLRQPGLPLLHVRSVLAR